MLTTAFGHPTIAVDTHIFRVSNRLGLARGTTVQEVERKLMKAVPLSYRHNAHHWLLLHGRYVCKARRPECWRCLVEDLCAYKPKSLPPPARSPLDRAPSLESLGAPESPDAADVPEAPEGDAAEQVHANV